MSSSNRRSYLEAGGWVVVGALLISLAFNFAHYVVSADKLILREFNQEEENCRRAYYEAPPPPDLSTFSTRQQNLKTYREKKADNKKSARDYCVQRRAALASERQATTADIAIWVGGFTLLAAMFAAIFARQAAVATHESAIAGHKSAEATQRALNLSKRIAGQQKIDARRSQEFSRQSANAAARSAKVAEDALRGLERPYLFPHVTGSFLINIPRQGSTSGRTMWPNAEVKFINYGRIPAIPLVLSLEFDHLTRLADQLPQDPNVIIDPNTVIRPDGETGSFRKDMLLLDDAAVDSIVKGRTFIWFYGCLTYLAPTGDEHETAFCWCYNGLTGRFGPYAHKQNRIT